MALLEATSQPFSSRRSTGTAGQSRFCTTAVGASMNIPEGEYSMRTSDGVRNSKRAFPAAIVVAPGVATAHDAAGARPKHSPSAATAKVQQLRMAGANDGACAADALAGCGSRRRMLIGDEDVRLQSRGTRQQVTRLTRRVVVDVPHREEWQDLLGNLFDELAV